MNTSLQLSACPATLEGKPRHIGVELEFKGIGLPEVVRILETALQGSTTAKNDYHYKVQTAYGDFHAEIDFQLLQKLSGKELAGEATEWESLGSMILSPLSQPFAPVEVSTPPLLPKDTGLLPSLVEKLRDAGAEGTRTAPWRAFGLHFNIEAPALRAETLRHYLQAFCLLYDWLKERMDLDITRLVSLYISGYDQAYHHHILRPQYQPDLDGLIRDYLHFNPGRNYALDMLPLFAHIHPDYIRGLPDAPLVKARPAFHFRMPDCLIDEPGWQIADEWPHWLAVEKVANDAALRTLLLQRYAEERQRLLHRLDDHWVQTVETLMRQHDYA